MGLSEGVAVKGTTATSHLSLTFSFSSKVDAFTHPRSGVEFILNFHGWHMEARMGSSLYNSMTTKAWILLPTSSDILKCPKELLVAVCMETTAAEKKVPWESWKRGDHGIWMSTEPERGWPGVRSCQWLTRDGHQVWGRNPANTVRTGSPYPGQSHAQAQLLQGPLTFFSWKNCTYLRYLGSGKAEFAEKAASQSRAWLAWCCPPVKGVYVAQWQKGPGLCSERWWEEVPVLHSDPVLVRLPFSQQRLFFSQSYGTLWNASLVHDKRRPR